MACVPWNLQVAAVHDMPWFGHFGLLQRCLSLFRTKPYRFRMSTWTGVAVGNSHLKVFGRKGFLVISVKT